MHLIDKITEHLLGHLEITDDAIDERASGDDMAWGFPDHLLGFASNSENLTRALVYRNDRRLVDDDTLART
jgi:hypothetical protein